MEKTLAFDAKSHSYTYGGIPVPSVTQVLKSEGFIETRFCSEFGLERGSRVHEACSFLFDGALDWKSVDSRILSRVRACERFIQESGFRALETEKAMIHRSSLYAGTLDAYGMFQGRYVVVDLKCGPPAAWHGLQLAAYQELLSANRLKCQSRFTLHLRDNGTYDLRAHRDPRDLGVFLSACNVFRRKNPNGGTSNETGDVVD